MKFPVAILAGVKTQTAEAMLTVGKVPLAKIGAVFFVSALLPFLLNKYGAKLTMGDVLYRWTWVVAFAINVICVSIPGRFDGQMVDGKIAVVWKSAFAPSGWAFAIWGIIYLAELLGTVYIAFAPSTWEYGYTVQKLILKEAPSLFGFLGGGSVASLEQPTLPSGFNTAIKAASLYWLAGNLYQSLWCFCFRPEFKYALWLPAVLLAAGAVSLYGAHNELTVAMNTANSFNSKLVLGLLRWPISLHATWLTAASLLNVNGWAAVSNISFDRMLALANASSYLAGFLGIALTLRTGDSFIGLTVAWALTALADKTANNCDVSDALGKIAVQALALTEIYLARLVAFVSVVVIPILSSKAIEKIKFS